MKIRTSSHIRKNINVYHGETLFTTSTTPTMVNYVLLLVKHGDLSHEA